MKTNESNCRNKGGRPRKANKKTQVISMKCTGEQQTIIQFKARTANLSVSEYLVTIAVNGKVDKTERALPKEVLSLIGTIHHIASNINQIAKRANMLPVKLSELELSMLRILPAKLLTLTSQMKTYFQ